jgi:hypothetical protein
VALARYLLPAWITRLTECDGWRAGAPDGLVREAARQRELQVARSCGEDKHREFGTWGDMATGTTTHFILD